MRMCNFCGVEAVDPETGECTYCPGHKARVEAEAEGQAADDASDVDGDGKAPKGAKAGKAAPKGAKAGKAAPKGAK